jgi:hypothetical protein
MSKIQSTIRDMLTARDYELFFLSYGRLLTLVSTYSSSATYASSLGIDGWRTYSGSIWGL